MKNTFKNVTSRITFMKSNGRDFSFQGNTNNLGCPCATPLSCQGKNESVEHSVNAGDRTLKRVGWSSRSCMETMFCLLVLLVFYSKERLSYGEVAKRAQNWKSQGYSEKHCCSSCGFNSVLHKTAAAPLSSLMVD